MKINWRWEIPQLLLLVVMVAVSGWAWPSAPDRVPIHWNIKGEIDGYGSKALGLWLMPAIAAGLYLLLLLLPRIDPGRENVANSAKPLRAIRLALLVFLTGLHVICVRAALGAKISMNLFICLSVGALFIVLGNYLGKLRPNWFAGVRTPWTLSSQLSWTKTHRLAGPVFMAMGVGMALLAFVPTGGMLAIIMGLDFSAILGLVVYSYVVWKHDPDRISPAGVSAASEADRDIPEDR